MLNILAYILNNELDWNKPILTVDASDQSKLALFNWNLKSCPKKLRDTAYTKFIGPASDYSCSVRHQPKNSINDKIEKLQCKAA